MKEDKVDFKWIFALNVLGGIGVSKQPKGEGKACAVLEPCAAA
jgi:hypothetical protein